MKHLFGDIETLGIVDQSVILSAGFIAVDISKEFTPNELYENSIHVKFDSADQHKRLGRYIDQGTIDWWKKQDKEVIHSEVAPDPERDYKLEDGIEKIRHWINNQNFDKKNGWVWTRGGLDAKLLQHVTDQIGVEQLFPYYCVRDVRTAVDLLGGTKGNGYCEVQEGFDLSKIPKHNPVNDCIWDALMIAYPKGEV